MNAKQAAPLTVALAPTIATIAPPLLLIGGIIALVAWLLSDNDKKKPEKPPEKSVPLRPLFSNPPNSGGNSAQNACIPANSGGKTTVPPPLAAFPANFAPTLSKIPDPPPSVISTIKTAPQIPKPPPKKTITRETMAEIFKNGGRKLDRKAAVTSLKALGFGKSAAYEAFETNGRFAPWLRFAPDGIITWTD